MAGNALHELGHLLMKELPSAEEQPEQKSMAMELLKYATVAPTDKPQFRRKVPAWMLLGIAEKSQPVRTCIDAVVRECTRSTQYYDRCWDFYPKDDKALIAEDEAERDLGEPEVQGEPEETEPAFKALPPAPVGPQGPDEQPLTDDTAAPEGLPRKKSTRPTINRKEYELWKELFEKPDRRNRKSFQQILEGIFYDLLVFDEFYVSVAFDPDTGMPVALYNEEPDGMEMRVDKRGDIGDGTWFCEQCDPEREYKESDAPDHNCPVHGTPMKETAFVQVFGGKVRARWSKDEMIYNRLFRAGARGYGSPPLMSLFFAVSNLMAMDQYFSDAYALQHTPRGFVVFNGVDQGSVSRAATVAEESVEANPMSVPWFGLPEGKAVQFISLFSTPEQMQSTEFYKMYSEMVYKTFHVVPIVSGSVESGKSGNNPSIQLDVQNDFTRAFQRAVSEAFNNSVLPEAFKVEAWYFGFTPIEEAEELQEAQTQLAWANVAKAWQDARFDIALDEDGKPYPTGNTPKEPEPSPFGLPPGMGSPPFGGSSPEQQIPPKLESSTGTQPFGEPPKQASAESTKALLQGGSKAKSEAWYWGLIKGAPKPTGNEDWATGLRSTELSFYRGLDTRYKAAVDEAIGELKGLDNPTPKQIQAVVDRAFGKMQGDLVETAKRSMQEAYETAFEDAAAEMDLEMEMSGRDEQALAWMESHWSGVESVLPEFADDQKEVFSQLIRAGYEREGGFSAQALIDDFKKVSTAETWKLARIVRSEITLIGNNARGNAWKQADREGLFKYDWSAVDDSCDVCNNIAAGNPYKYDDLAEESAGGDGQPFRPHPFCRCTIVRHVREVKGKSLKDPF